MAAGKRIFRKFFAIYAIFLLCLMLLLVPSYQRSLKEVENRTLETMSAVLASGMKQMGPVLTKLREALTGIQMGTVEAPEGWIRKIL